MTPEFKRQIVQAKYDLGEEITQEDVEILATGWGNLQGWIISVEKRLRAMDPPEDTESLIEQLDEALCTLLHIGDEVGEHSPRTHLDLFYARAALQIQRDANADLDNRQGQLRVKLAQAVTALRGLTVMKSQDAGNVVDAQSVHEIADELEQL
jgi:hypothetical protein